MDLEKNRIPEKVETVHLIAACGTAMGALACILKEMGYRVTGSDQNVYPPMSTFLADKGISLGDGFDPANLEYRPDLVVVGIHPQDLSYGLARMHKVYQDKTGWRINVVRCWKEAAVWLAGLGILIDLPVNTDLPDDTGLRSSA